MLRRLLGASADSHNSEASSCSSAQLLSDLVSPAILLAIRNLRESGKLSIVEVVSSSPFNSESADLVRSRIVISSPDNIVASDRLDERCSDLTARSRVVYSSPVTLRGSRSTSVGEDSIHGNGLTRGKSEISEFILLDNAATFSLAGSGADASSINCDSNSLIEGAASPLNGEVTSVVLELSVVRTRLVANRGTESTSNSISSSLLTIVTNRSHSVLVRVLGIGEVVLLGPDVGLESTRVRVKLGSLGLSELSLTDNVTLSHVITGPSESNLVSGSGETLKSTDNGSSYTAYGLGAQTYNLRGRSLHYLSIRS